MKRLIVIAIALLLFVGCGSPKASTPQVQLDARAEAATTPAPETAAPATKAPAEATAAPEITAEPTPKITEAPTAEPAPQGSALVERLVTAWVQKGYLNALYPLDYADALDLYGIDFTACRDGVAYGDAAGYTNEAVVAEGDAVALDQVEALLRAHLEAVKAQFKGYDPKALALTEKAVLVREGDAVLFIISPDAEAMLAVFRDLTK